MQILREDIKQKEDWERKMVAYLEKGEEAMALCLQWEESGKKGESPLHFPGCGRRHWERKEDPSVPAVILRDREVAVCLAQGGEAGGNLHQSSEATFLF